MYSIDELNKALAKAQAANDQQAVAHIQNLIQQQSTKAGEAAQGAAIVQAAPAGKVEGSVADALGQGAMLGWSDELAGALGATFGSIMPERLGGLPDGVSWRDAYRGITDQARLQEASYAQENPIQALVGNLAGGLVTGGIGLTKALGTQAAKQSPKLIGAATGAVEGAIAGAGASEEDERGRGALVGGAVGAPTGFAGGWLFDLMKGKTQTQNDLVTQLSDEMDMFNAKTAGKMLVEAKNQGAKGQDLITIGEDIMDAVDSSRRNQKSGVAGFIENMRSGSRVVDDELEKKALDLGWEPKFVVTLRDTKPEDRQAMIRMLEYQRGANDNRFKEVRNRPSTIAGETLAGYVDDVVAVKNDAGNKLNAAIDNLRRGSTEIQDPRNPQPSQYGGLINNLDNNLNRLVSDFEEMGIKFGRDESNNLRFDEDGMLDVNFKGSDIEGLEGLERSVKRLLNRLSTTDSYELPVQLHRMKKYIDENVSYGKGSTEGLEGTTLNVFKRFRRGINKALGDYSPEYAQANKQYRDSKTALDALNNATPSKLDIEGSYADQTLGSEMRKFFSNYASRGALEKSIAEIQGVVNNYGGKANADLFRQAMMFDELNMMFGTPARTSFEGLTRRATGDATRAGQDIGLAATGSPEGIGAEIFRRGVEQLAGKSKQPDPDEMIDALIEILKRGR